MDELQRLEADLCDLGAEPRCLARRPRSASGGRHALAHHGSQEPSFGPAPRRGVAMLSATTPAVPAARAAIADLFGFAAEHIRASPPPATATVDDTLRIGPAVSLDDARQRQRSWCRPWPRIAIVTRSTTATSAAVK